MNTEERTNVTAVAEVKETSGEAKKKKLSKGGIVAIVIGAIAALCVASLALIFIFRVDWNEAKAIALAEVGGGEVVSTSSSSEGLWREYDFVIQNGDVWYEVEVGGFGNITEIESGIGQKYISCRPD